MAKDIDSKNNSDAKSNNSYYKNVLLIGSPNVGKSLTFNKLTGMTAMVSNYPGTTVDIDEGNFTYEGKTLKNGTDYEICYENNVETGTAIVVVFGIGNYCGMNVQTFTIMPIDVAFSKD